MRDSQSLLEQLLSVSEKRITAAEVHRLLGTAPVERLSGLLHHIADRNAAAALAELDAAVAGGVEVGQLLDQLIGYFRDVMALAVGCAPQQMLYALPSQAEEVAAIGKQLGLPTVLAMVQILDQTAARLRVSLHGRTLVEMAIVRICQLDDLDELSALVAELRGEAGSVAPAAPATAKKNVEPRPAISLGAIPTLPKPDVRSAPVVAPIAVEAPAVAATSIQSPPTNGAADEEVNGVAREVADSVLMQFKLAVEAKQSGAAEPTAPRVSRRQQAAEQLKEASERPFVKRALELFDVNAGQLRYSPPESE
jgi:DNA polymerase-3 subunit gamma/tau